MSWHEVAVVVEAAASFAVVISLIYLAIQVRLQAKENKMSVVNSLTQQWGEALRVFATDKDLYDIWIRGIEDFDSLSPNERGRLSAILVNLTQIFEALHLHHRSGKIDAGLWEGFDNRLRDVFATPGVQHWWSLRKHWHTRRFQDYVDRAIASAEKQKGRYAAIYGSRVCDIPGAQSVGSPYAPEDLRPAPTPARTEPGAVSTPPTRRRRSATKSIAKTRSRAHDTRAEVT